MTARPPSLAAAGLALVVALALGGCLENRTVRAVTLEVDNSLGVFNIGAEPLNTLFAVNLVDQFRLRRKMIEVDRVGGETIFLKLLSDTVTPAPNRFLGEGQTHTVTASWRFRGDSGTISIADTFRGSSVVSRFVTSVSGLTSLGTEVEVPPEFKTVVEDLNIQLLYALNL